MAQNGWATDDLKRRIAQTAESFSHLKDSEKTSIGQFARETMNLRSNLQKAYERTLQRRAEKDRRLLIGLGALVLIGIMFLLTVSIRKLSRWEKGLLLFLFLGGSLSFSACSSGPGEAAKKSPAQEQLEQSLRIATRMAERTERAFYHAVLLAEMAREWSFVEPTASERAFRLAWKIALGQGKEWERIRSLQNILPKWPDRSEARKQKVNFDTVLDLRDELRNLDGRTWALRAIAEQWVQVDSKEGRRAMEFAFQKAREIKDPEVRDRDLRSIAQAWGRIDERRALEASRSLSDPFLKALALLDTALLMPDKDRTSLLVKEAWKTAQSITPPYSQCKACLRISAAGARIHPEEGRAWAEQMLAKVQDLKDPQLRAFVLLEMASQWAPIDEQQAEAWTEAISSEFPELRAYSFIRLAQTPGISKAKGQALLKKALEEAIQIEDSYESEKVKTLAIKGLAALDPLEATPLVAKVGDPYYRSEILGEIAERISRVDQKKALELADRIPLEPFRMRTKVRTLGQGIPQDRQIVSSFYQEAFRFARSIPDPFSRARILIELGRDWGHFEKGKGPVVFEEALKAAEEISFLSYRAEVLESLASAWKGQDPAKGASLLERIDPSVLAVRKILSAIQLWGPIDPSKAQRWAESIPFSFPQEKARALKEVAASLKKSQPAEARILLEKAFQLALGLPEGAKQGRLISEMVRQSACMDKEWALIQVSRTSERAIRDFFFRELGITWALEEPLWALRAARGISESSLRLNLYQRIADSTAQKIGGAKAQAPQPTPLLALAAWGQGRERAKREEVQAIPFFEKALQRMEKIEEPTEKSYLLSGLAADWAPLDEKKALELAEKISGPQFSEPCSYALLQVGAQYSKWNRKEAEAIFSKTLSAADKIGEPSLRAQRLLQLALQWKIIDPEKGKEVLKRAEGEARRSLASPEKEGAVLSRILLAEATWEPKRSPAIGEKGDSPLMRAKVLMEAAKILRTRTIEDKMKILDEILQTARREKDYRLMGEVAWAWSALDLPKALEILGQVGSREIRVKTLRQIARGSLSLPEGAVERLLDRAYGEALAAEGITEKIRFLKEIATDWGRIDKRRAQAIYRKVFQILEREYPSVSEF